ncbi:hypothetical protein AAZX31_15G055100 [Glycine max]|nr:uncharacterized protein LOC102659744 [Glycine max]XP_028204624.1 uncharacterized protein LOC114388376 [Glycine soja]KAG4948305.1 hypothetical protein JHK86_041544 [Glycine max]KAG4955771.1 hypothetical protein JHK85_042151 [Glycine max]KAG5104515.1 hypothetical protein JHK82_041485 [Glycine max]KAG5115641.1 hypothetical protein JHK84_041754 [Glycine max]KAH1207998.1 hypothetical protein GmHk_15G042932 [Glycine max]|eukprot:XP_006597360.1 uncharacterized protein LOC102659744 [Glycine max]
MGSTMKNKHLHDGRTIAALNPESFLVIRIPDALVLRILSRSLFVAMVLAALPFLGTVLKGFYFSSSFVPNVETAAASGSLDVGLLNSILHDFAHEGLLRENDKALVLNSPLPNVFREKIDVVMDSDWESKSLFADVSYDFVFTSGDIDAEFIDRILKIDGIVALPLGSKPSNSAFKEQNNYRVVSLKRYGTAVVVALKKTGPAVRLVDSDSSPKRKLLATKTEAKSVALKGLEDVLLEPPRKALVKSRKYLNKIKYLPDLVGDSLEGYKRRVFIGVGLPEENKGVMQWFKENYPKKNTKFETHSVAVVPEDHFAVSAWLSKNVKEEEYVVMKAEAGVVEEMMKTRTIRLVDELFLECKNEWWQRGKTMKKNERTYWECLALYGRVRDEGVAVHQWWG